ncbi:MAG: hypothetical protein NDI60_04330 [Elusimicrobiales bacterium]|nr:hypothetical protein [Elusimicrobiales bacterium]
MRIFLILLFAASQAAAAPWGEAQDLSAGRLLAARAEIEVIGGAPLPDLLAAKDKASLPVTLAGMDFLASVVFDAEWETWFTLKPAAGLGAGAWKETSLGAGAVYKYGGAQFLLKAADGVVTITGPGGEKAEVKISGLFDKLYADSLKITFGGLVTYAVFRNLEPLSEEEGTVTMRLGHDGLYYYSVTRDALVQDYPRWLLAVNGVLYGLRTEAASLLFVSKKIDLAKPAPVSPEKPRAR